MTIDKLRKLTATMLGSTNEHEVLAAFRAARRIRPTGNLPGPAHAPAMPRFKTTTPSGMSPAWDMARKDEERHRRSAFLADPARKAELEEALARYVEATRKRLRNPNWEPTRQTALMAQRRYAAKVIEKEMRDEIMAGVI